MKKKEPKRFITQRDFEILQFLWRWKAVSTLALAKRFYPGVRPFTAYQRLLKLERARFIKSYSFRHRMGSAWTLDNRGFRFIFPYLPGLKEDGFASENPLHDYYSTAFHLGEWLNSKPASGFMCSEQEMRRLHPDLLPNWVPTSNGRRPDGFSLVGSGKEVKLYAFEAELTQKSKGNYENILAYYDEEESISGVFWLVASANIQKVIQGQILNLSFARPKIHYFLQLSEFKKLGWYAPMSGGLLSGKTMAFALLDGDSTTVRPKSDDFGVTALLQNAKRPFVSKPSDSAPPAPTSD